ncbi:MAG: DUF2341 domain-containing protein, partial [Eudoraea sp.]|nr:DUF2341 domain-containing protein [Eudoraea sp.]
DVVFIDSEGKKLSHEIESFATSSTGAFVGWVKIPSLSSTEDTVVNMYYGNAGVNDQQDVENVWDDNYKAVWHFRHENNASTSESTKYNVTGKVESNASTTGSGKMGGAFQFDGVDGTDILINNLPSIVTPYTISFWLYPKEVGRQQGLFSLSSTYAPRFMILSDQLLAQGGAEKFRYGSTVFDSGDLNKWWYVSMVVSSSTDLSIWKVYLNGSDDSGTTGANSGDYYEPTSSGYVGKCTGCGSGKIFYGNLDEIRVSSGERSQTWIQTSYNNQNSPQTFLSIQAEETGPGPVGYWSFDEGQGTTAADLSGQGNDGYFHCFGAGCEYQTWADESMCVSGNCLYFDKTKGGYFRIDKDYSFPAVTYSAWIRPASSTIDSYVMNKHAGGSYGWGLEYEDGILQIHDDIGGGDRKFYSTRLELNKWYHVAIGIEEDLTNVMYINGVLIGNDQSSNYSLDEFYKEIFTIGTRGENNTTNVFHGYIDEAKIYPYARSADEIKADYAAGLAGIKSQTGVSASFGSESVS